jgi:hypothetical protein
MLLLALGLILTLAPLAADAQVWPGKTDPDGLTADQIRAALPEYFSRGGRSTISPEALPDVFGPGAVLNVGNIHMKVTNWGHVGNLFTNLSSDPSGQWRGASAVEYLSSIRLSVGAMNPVATDLAGKRRVSYLLEWRPETLDPVDKMYRAYDGIINGTRLFNDDGDRYIDPGNGESLDLIDEDFLDGHDNDGDRKIDEDYGALGQQMYTCVMWDNTIQAINSTFNEKHVPIGLECRQRAWAYSIRGFQDFNVVEYEIFNRSGHDLDSVSVGFLVDMDAGPLELSNFFNDDFDLPVFPHGEFEINVGTELPDELRRQFPHDRTVPDVDEDAPLCPTYKLRINGFSTADDNGDEDRTVGIPSFLLVEHSVDPLGRNGPKQVGFRGLRSFTAGTPFPQGGNPTIDQQRFEFLTAIENLDLSTGFIRRDITPGDTKGDYVQWVSLGSPVGAQGEGGSHGLWKLGQGQSIHVTIAFAVKEGTHAMASGYVTDYERYHDNGTMSMNELLDKYPALANAFALQIAYEGVHVLGQEGFPLNDFHGRETAVRRPVGAPDSAYVEDCPGRETRTVFVNSRQWSWFDFDCNYCTGPWNFTAGQGNDPTNGGLFQRTWNAAAPPPSPSTNVSSNYNFTDNPNRVVVAAGDRQVVIAWDNLSEVTADPKSECFDFRSYRLWKVSDWSRPVGSAGPAEADWRLIGEFRLFDYEDIFGRPIERNYTIDPNNGRKDCPMVYVPNYVYIDSTTGQPAMGDTIPICLDRGDLWDRQSGMILEADTSLACVPNPADTIDGCSASFGGIVHRVAPLPTPCKAPANKVRRIYYPVGRYRYVDTEVKNGFAYFYSITASDSTYENGVTTELEGRRSAVESEAVVPQVAARTGRNVWVVPNPYRGYSRIADRPSSWDLTPNASDPTGTHVDFMGLPSGGWTIRVYTVAGDLVAEIKSSDPVNDSVRGPQVVPGTNQLLPGFNRQQDSDNDGQARWNLISRNGQDIVSGIYLFTVSSNQGTQRGKFVVIR